LYSDEGLIGEYNAAGVFVKGYGWKLGGIWGSDPLFMFENGQYYYYHNDHLGTPHTMTDSAGAVVWSAEYTAFGHVVVDPTSTKNNNLRFAGQYYDVETGLHYNWNRYYDPSTGRYMQVDPIGFAGLDQNLYRYVANMPMQGTDPEAKIGPAWIVVGAVLALIGMATEIYHQYHHPGPVEPHPPHPHQPALPPGPAPEGPLQPPGNQPPPGPGGPGRLGPGRYPDPKIPQRNNCPRPSTNRGK
jgi:RHS repeat-associated protein